MDQTTEFRSVMRGYDPAQVDRRLGELAEALAAAERSADAAQQQAANEHQQLLEANRRITSQSAAPITSDFGHLGERIGQMLTLAEQEAAQLRAGAAAEVRAKLAEIEAGTTAARTDADRYAIERRIGAEREATRMIEAAQLAAEELTDEALAQVKLRREQADAELAERREQAQLELVGLEQRVGQLRAEVERATSDASRRAAQLVNGAELKANRLVAEATARAEEIRATSERELAEANERRDAIDTQLANVRQMLSALSGAAPEQPAD